MTTLTRDHVTDVFAVPVTTAEVATVPKPPVRTEAPPARHCFTKVVPADQTGDPVAADLQELIDAKYKHLCVCAPNRAEMLAADAEMRAHPGYAAYKARRDAAMGHG